MAPRGASRLVYALCLTMAIAACGGADDPPPTPLASHFDDMYIAQVSLDQKQGVIQAQNEYSVAKMEKAKAEADWNSSTTELEVANNERQAKLLDEKSAASRKKAADDSGDQNRVNTAVRELRAAELGRRAADQKVEWINAQRNWLKRHLRYTEENTYAQEARYELAKARVAKENNIKPKGFDPGVYERQAEDRSRRAQQARAKAEREKGSAEQKRQQWEAQKKEADKMQPSADSGSMPSPSGGE
jgi:hypothetical protein